MSYQSVAGYPHLSPSRLPVSLVLINKEEVREKSKIGRLTFFSFCSFSLFNN
jgi:hypothetical protein